MYFEKVSCMAIYIVKIGVWNASQTMWDSFQTLVLMQKTFIFYVSETIHTRIGLSLHVHANGFPSLNFPKIDLFAH